MAFETGTATDYADLLTKLNTFVTATLPVAERWTALRATAGSEYIWRAPGLSGTDQIYVGAKTFSDVATDYYDWRLGGFTGFDSALAFTAQPGAMTGPCLPLWQNSMTYWFFGNGRRVIVVAKVSTRYEAAHLGFMNPYASPGQFPYPLLIGGSLAFETEPGSTDVRWRWSNNAEEHRGFFDPSQGPSNTFQDVASQLRLRRPDGVWRGFSNFNSSGSRVSSNPGSVWPGQTTANFLRANLDASYTLFPFVLNQDNGSGGSDVFGEIDGVFWVSGHNNASENTVTIGVDVYRVFPNIFRIGNSDFCAVKQA